jgi:hypothetical protein
MDENVQTIGPELYIGLRTGGLSSGKGERHSQIRKMDAWLA